MKYFVTIIVIYPAAVMLPGEPNLERFFYLAMRKMQLPCRVVVLWKSEWFGLASGFVSTSAEDTQDDWGIVYPVHAQR
jgi:hypothetical protein